jgi:acetylornithine deacetylase
MNNDAYISLLKSLIKTPSLSGKEEKTTAILLDFMKSKNWKVDRIHNNLIVRNANFDETLETVVLNSHHDTVSPNKSYTYDPFEATEIDGKIIGLGSNDAGASLVSLMAAFDFFYDKDLKKNLIIVASAEEENSGDKGIRSVLPSLPSNIDIAIIGEPTNCEAAIAEKGLLVIDGIVKGEAGHAARPNGKNAIDFAVEDISVINKFQFEKSSKVLGPVVKSVTQINAGTQHNVIPDICTYVIDVRVNECYGLTDVFDQLQSITIADLKARSFKNNPSFLPFDHSFTRVIEKLKIPQFGSPTLSDQAHFNCPSLKIGPGFSERSHQADEFIYIQEIEEGIAIYIKLLTNYLL